MRPGAYCISLLYFLLIFHIPLCAAAPDFRATIKEIASSFTDSSGTVTFKVTVSRASVRSRRKQNPKRIKQRVFLRLDLPVGSQPVRLPTRCVAAEHATPRFECPLGKIARRRSKSRRFTIKLSTGCATAALIQTTLFRKNRTDRNPANDSALLSLNPHCSNPPDFEDCAPLTNTSVHEISVSTVQQLRNAVATANAQGDTTILVADGTYLLNQGLAISGNSITIRSASGQRDAVLLRGAGVSGGTSHLFWITGDDVAIADMTLGYVANHAIQIHGEQDADRPLLHNLHIVNVREQFVKGSYSENSPNRSEGGVVQCSTFEFLSGEGVQYYTGGIDVHNGLNWVVRNNVFKNIKSPNTTLAEHAIHFWSDAAGTLVERNVILNCDRGIGFGLGNRGHNGGTIRNNFIYHDSSPGDVGIGLENASNVDVYHNTIFFENSYPFAIEYRFGNTSASIINNLTNRSIQARDGGSALISHNFTSAQKGWFIAPEAGDLHIKQTAPDVINATGLSLGATVSEDFDGDPRSALHPDIGADEF